MQHIDRQKLILFIGIGVALLLAIIVILVSVFTSPKEEPGEPTPEPTQQVTENPGGEDTTVDPPIVGNPTETDAPPENMYDNDYSKDEGYTPLPETFDPNTNATTDTAYDDEFVYFTHSRLMCELSNKKVSTEQALEPLKNFVSDLSVNGSSLASTSRITAEEEIKWYMSRLGERVGVDKQQSLEHLYCNQTEIDLYENDEGHEH